MRARTLACLIVAACGGSGDDTAVDARARADAPPACATPDVALGLVVSDGAPTRIYAHVTVDGGPDTLFLVDTGSQHTFVSTPDLPDGSPDAGVVRLGCETRAVIGRPVVLAETFEGQAVSGILGTDYFLEALRELDFTGARIVTSVDDDAHTAWPSVAFDASIGYLFVPLAIDGQAVEMGFDTGAAHTLWLRQPIEEGDVEVQTQDAYGNDLTLGLGSETIAIGDFPERTVPVFHAPSFPSLEDSNEAIGRPELAGLVALTTVPGPRVRIDPARAAIYVAP